MIQAQDRRIVFLIKALVALVFLAKISLGAFLPLPFSFSFFIFQKGLHPLMNVFLSFLLGLPLLVLFLRVRDRQHLSGVYKIFTFTLMFVLSVQTLLQISLQTGDESPMWQLGALGSSLFMIVIYGLVIPSLWTVDEFLKFVQKWSGFLVLISLIFWPVLGDALFKGGRFIGVFKHIPYMVTAATVAFVFSLGTLLQARTLRSRLWSVLILLSSFVAIVLTGTRSSAGAAVVALLLTLVLHRSQTNWGRLFKFSFGIFVLTYSLFFGVKTLEFAQEIATGQARLGARQAQDGVASRWEEIERGKEIFLQAPWMGHGLLSKFSSAGDVEAGNYNSLKDPHNIFISAGVIGGWPLLLMSGLSVFIMLIGAVKTLRTKDISQRQVGIYLASHIPILVIYHAHLSLGGMADRIYWMIFGFVAVTVLSRRTRPSV